MRKDIPGTLYQNGNTWWWAFQLDGVRKHLPLIVPGQKYATRDKKTAEIIRQDLWDRMVQQRLRRGRRVAPPSMN